jgi:ADP-ribose pyrophosphatase
MLEFPAGLIDEGETPAETALRELKEETGYMGRVESVTPPLYTSPGLLSESCYLTYVSIDEAIVENRFPQAENEPGESIEVIVLEAGKVLPYLEVASKNGDGIDIKLFTYFYKNEK